MYICIPHIRRHVFRPSQNSSVLLGSTSREQMMSPENSFPKMRWICQGLQDENFKDCKL